METHKIVKGCEALRKIQVDVEHSHYLKEFLLSMDETTKYEVKEAINKVLLKRQVEIEQEIKNIVNTKM